MMNSRLTELHAAIQRGIRDSKPLAGIVRVSPQCGISIRPMSVQGLGRVKTFSCKRSELDEVATRAFSRL
jgi:hypothetical protein